MYNVHDMLIYFDWNGSTLVVAGHPTPFMYRTLEIFPEERNPLLGCLIHICNGRRCGAKEL